MRVALLAPITHRVPPNGYGPWEQVVGDLARGLFEAGHRVTVFGPASSPVTGDLIVTVPHALDDWPTDQPEPDPRIWEEVHIAETFRQVARGQFDIVHNHLGVHPLGFARLSTTPTVTTLHGVASNPAVHPMLERFGGLPFVSISNAERRFRPDLNYVATVHNGISPDEFPEGDGAGGFLLFAGRLAPEKAPHLAIEVSRRSGRFLRMAGMVEPIHRAYFDDQVAPALQDRSIDYLGDVSRIELANLYRSAAALIMPLAWDEPFGLVVVESLMSGTPVIAWRRGAMPELIEDGVTGHLVDGVASAIRATGAIDQLDRTRCRTDAVTRFSYTAMASGYVAAYESVLGGYTETISSRTSSSGTVANLTPQSEKPKGTTSNSSWTRAPQE